MRAKLITNPYIVYAFGFLLTLVIYTFQWSGLYPPLSFQLFFFITITALFSLLTGLVVHKTNYASYTKISYSAKTLWAVTTTILAGYFIECAYMGTIPLMAIINGSNYDYTTFGIPTFHVILVTFNSFWSVFVFHNYLSSRKKHLLLCYGLCLFPAFLIFNRGMLLLNLASGLFVLLMSARRVRRMILLMLFFVIGILFLFGLAGNIRITQGKSINDVILNLGEATDKFRESDIPKEFFWSYLYITSPLANVQETINKHDISSFSLRKFGTFANKSFLPDFISKRNIYFTEPIEHVDQISVGFTVGTVYGTSYAYLGWWGMYIMYFFLLLFNLFVIVVLSKNSIFFVTGIAILDCIMLFSIFDNMFAFSGLSMQLFYPLVFGILSRVRLKPKPLQQLQNA
jgi:hypothetical protein